MVAHSDSGAEIIPIRSRCPACQQRFSYNPRSLNPTLVPPHWPDGAYCPGSFEYLAAAR